MVQINRSEKSTLIWGLIWMALTFLLLFGCATTKPNRSVFDPDYYPPRGSENDENFLEVKSILAEISSQNPLVAIELGKLPELQDGVTSEERKALEDVAQIYNTNPDVFNEAFEQMYRVGLPETRRYCSPLQALFWLAEDDELNEQNDPLINYSLENLLNSAWIFDGFHGSPMSDR